MHSYRERNIAQAYATSNAALEFYFLNARLLYTFFRLSSILCMVTAGSGNGNRNGIDSAGMGREWEQQESFPHL